MASLMLEGRRVFPVISITIVLALYLVFLTWSSSPFIGVWPLEGIFWETVAVIVAISLLSYLLFDSRASIIVPLITQAFLVVVLPVLKHPNTLNITGPWDSAAHYSFAKWIIVNGHVDTAGILYYSNQYGYHPGNGIIPASLNLLSSITLGWSMNIVLIMIYTGYILFILATLKSVGWLKSESIDIRRSLWLLAIITLSIPLPVYYGGVEIGYIYAGGILYAFIRLMRRKEDGFKSIILVLVIFWSLLITHFSTAVIMLAYMLIIVSMLITAKLFSKTGIPGITPKVMILTFMMLSAFVIYEIYSDIFLFTSVAREAIHILYSLYIREIQVAKTAMETKGLSFLDLVQYLVSHYAKNIIVLTLIFIHTIGLSIRWRSLNHDEKMLALLLFASYPTWIIGWAGVGSFLAGARTSNLICFLLSVSLAMTYEKVYVFLTKSSRFAFSLFLIVLGFVANFGLPFMPVIRTDGDTYTYTVFSQGGFSDYVLHPITYVSSYNGASSFLCLSPYIAFGLCDIMWQTPKIPKHGSISPSVRSPEGIMDIVRNYLGKQAIIPQPLRESLIPDLIGYRSLYKKTFYFLLENGEALIYNNGMYTLFLV
jgi:hypothetical protein